MGGCCGAQPIGLDLSQRLLAALGGDRTRIEAYGKGAIVGSAGEIEHSALWHVPGGYAMREMLGKALAIVPSAVKMGALGTVIDLPTHHKDACYVRSHFDAVTAMIPDAPRADEIVFFLAMTTGGRPHARVGGLKVADIALWDGLR
jgi:Amino acid synthesis